MQTKHGYVTFDHDTEFKGEVEIKRGAQSMRVPIESLRAFVAESIRNDLMSRVVRMKPADLLRRIA